MGLRTHLKLKLEAIISKFNAGRQAAISFLVVEIVADMGQIRTGRLESLNDVHCLPDAKMARMRLIPQSVEYQHSQALKQRPTLLRDLVHVRAIGDVIDAKPKNFKMR